MFGFYRPEKQTLARYLCYNFPIFDLKALCLQKNFNLSGGVFDHDKHLLRLQEIEKQLAAPGAWDVPEKLTPVLREQSQLTSTTDRLNTLHQAQNDAHSWLEMAEEENTQEVLEQLAEQLELLAGLIENAELALLLSAPEDNSPAILELSPGAGGTEAQDWAAMLLRMYMRWIDKQKNLTAEYLDYIAGDETGLKSATIKVQGDNAYGLLKGERGIHRLIRISPYDASGRRHTSFAALDVYPAEDEELKIEINPSDLRIDIFRSSGPGGQSVNTTSSAVRIMHIPTGIVATCQNEKSQHHNKDKAMQILRARLCNLERAKREAEKQANYVAKETIAWGSQIRTYTLQPYKLVKDHRSKFELTDVDAVLDGNLDALIRNSLLTQLT